ncbi:21477_t:CDS:2 [Dentiscutata erythropus]|uniref:21477_t:CDS:1 n=1 Tax=Dentiscutata erythropus TaxID=1348616 RepID=A0A9N9JAR9_9GLOM|nr:21477_t:CDS:2 [Dentiscutata erythropus]
MNTEKDLRRRTAGAPISETLVEPQKTNTQRSSSRISRIINSFKWIIFAGWIFWYFEVDNGVRKVLSLNGGIPPPKYSTWKHDKTLGKFIPIATVTGIIGVMGMIIDFCNVWGFFGAFIVVLGLLRGVVAILDFI